ncbi:hypothetical protein [Sinimarinibacterium thermocellulolyticum]|uniref:Cobalt transport protein n=1 Tax=Sinimarinibacterium thermocellulolyticum TaxID=3170016 RepID=A0ABV2ADA1_9GAMM
MPLSVHPAVRVLLLLALASALPMMALSSLALIAAAALILHRALAADALARLRAGVFRLRWLLLAILVLYGGFTPGEPLAPALPGLSREGLTEGLRRALVLIDLMLAVYLLLALTSTAQLVMAVRTLLRPLRVFGVDPDRVGLRIALALDRVSSLERRLLSAPREDGGVWRRAAQLIEQIEDEARAVDGGTVELPAARAPRWWEWLLVLGLLAALHAAIQGGLA